MILIGLYQVFSICLFAIVVFIDIYALQSITFKKASISRESRLGLTFLLTGLITFVTVHFDAIWFDKITLVIFTVISGFLIGFFLQMKSLAGLKSRNNISTRGEVTISIFIVKSIIAVALSVLFVIFWQWLGQEVFFVAFFK
jgi:hypothetical protein